MRRYLLLSILFVITYVSLYFITNIIGKSSADSNQLSVGQTSTEQVQMSPKVDLKEASAKVQTENTIISGSHYIQNDESSQSMFKHKWLYIAGEFWLLGLLLA